MLKKPAFFKCKVKTSYEFSEAAVRKCSSKEVL